MMGIAPTYNSLATNDLTSRSHPHYHKSHKSGRRESNTHDIGWKPIALPIGHTRKRFNMSEFFHTKSALDVLLSDALAVTR
jgi:hypothetical protein